MGKLLLFSDKPGYFEPKLPVDSQLPANLKGSDEKHENERAGQIVQEQVLPPKHDDDLNNNDKVRRFFTFINGLCNTISCIYHFPSKNTDDLLSRW